jgi:hypothetical protein
VQLHAPDAVEDAVAQRAGRELHLSPSIDGTWFGRFTLDPIDGTIVAGEIARLERELFDRDWADAKERLGRVPVVGDLARTPAQRRADALVIMATRSATTPPGGRAPAPLFTVFVDVETLTGRICELADGTVVTPGSLVPWLSEAHVRRVVFDGPSRVTDVGATRRLFTGAARAAIQARDRTCYHPTCEEPASRCQIDHIHPWALGGPTTLDNGRLACGFHNRQRNTTTHGDDPEGDGGDDPP